MTRLLIVSNRLPVTIRREGRRARLESSTGGLATGLAPYHAASDGLWIGWPGEIQRLSAEARADVEVRLAERRFVAVELSAEEIQRYYEGYANGVLWPAFHYMPGELPLRSADWGSYEAVNQRFADIVAEHHEAGDRVWVHDYQLLRVPALLRERIPEARIGLFLHIPFPSYEIFRMLPERELLLAGMLGADLIGFHTASYMRHFASTLLSLLGVASELDRLSWDSREVRLGVFPIGIDAEAFATDAAREEIDVRVRELRRDGIQTLLGVDRLDYTKGIPRRLLAFEHLLERHPELHGRVRLIQVAVPSREHVRAYRAFRRQTDELIGRIQGAFATPSWVPVTWIYRSIERDELLGLYRAADVMLVTPLRDGMNLVAKEFVACRNDEDGVLVLSELAGAAVELAEALHVNPFDIERAADASYQGLTMGREERRSRMRALRRRVLRNDVHHFAERFLGALRATEAAEVSPRRAPPEPEQLVGSGPLVLLLDYDGTLVPFASTPDLATPDSELIDLLSALARRPGTHVHVVSGRGPETLEHWLGLLPIGLHAEHGLWSRPVGGAWQRAPAPQAEWREQARRLLEEAAANTPGSLVEEKTAGLAFHYRGADPEHGSRQANALQVNLTELLANAPVEVIAGAKVIELRPHGVNKGLVVANALADASQGACIMALGDDRTDEDLFAALPEGAASIHIGPSQSRARWHLASVGDAREYLRKLVAPAGSS